MINDWETVAAGIALAVSESRRHRVRYYLQHYLQRLQYEWGSRGFTVHAETSFDISHLGFIVSVRLEGFNRNYFMTEDELYMDGDRALHHWLSTVDRDIEQYLRTTPTLSASRRVADAADDWLYGRGPTAQMTATEVIRRRQEYNGSTNSRADQEITAAFMDEYVTHVQRLMNGSFSLEPKHTSEANDKAKELFKAIAGEEAFNTLETGPLPIKGSLGTDYTLHKRATFCVERPSDGAKLCAVVPGVPLWDHLLGIKLMVENDEPAFLRTANVAVGHAGEIWGRGFAEMFS